MQKSPSQQSVRSSFFAAVRSSAFPSQHFLRSRRTAGAICSSPLRSSPLLSSSFAAVVYCSQMQLLIRSVRSSLFAAVPSQHFLRSSSFAAVLSQQSYTAATCSSVCSSHGSAICSSSSAPYAVAIDQPYAAPHQLRILQPSVAPDQLRSQQSVLSSSFASCRMQ